MRDQQAANCNPYKKEECVDSDDVPGAPAGWKACFCKTDLCNGAISILLSARVSFLVLLPFLSVGRLLFL
ncbi:unnamed protein product [Darwinula stevensoni]|uniref:Uncharacterized protein n=1 Tax=Darwinula stevensoni TaxID=69355 RepID=A0A7R9AIC0_9CRUS|nr:unnamed protein product [Darwinula stevensoni]CAG0905398.1 unnamed protein product [Darwinula stevensoni]